MKKRILGLLTVLCMLAALVPCVNAAEIVASGSCGYDASSMKQTDDVTYVLYDDGHLVVSGKGPIIHHAFNQKSFSNDIKNVTINNGITDAGYAAFQDCKNIISVNLPNSVKNLFYTFAGCTSLKNITIPDSVTSLQCAFQRCTSLTDINIGNGVTDISYVFEDCTSLKRITIPSNIISMHEAFNGCTSLTDINISNGVTDISRAFANCTALKRITIPNSVTSMQEAFNGCTSLTDVNIGNGVTDVSCAFTGCTSLKNVTIPDSVTSMLGTFLGCSSIESIYIPENVTDIQIDGYVDGNPGSSASQYCQSFAGCSALKEINVSSQNKNFKSTDGILFTKDGNTLIQYPAGKTNDSYTIPSGTTEIAQGAFDDCANLKNIIISEGVSSIDCCAFAGCSSLESLSFPHTMTYIPCAMFDCTKLKKIFIPSTVTVLGNNPLLDLTSNTSLTDIYFEGSEEQWNNMEKRSWSMGNEFSNATIHYNSSGLPSPVPCFTVTDGKITNTVDTEQSAAVIIAAYDANGVLTDVNFETVTFNAGEEKSFQVPQNGKIFVWNSFGGMIPLDI